MDERGAAEPPKFLWGRSRTQVLAIGGTVLLAVVVAILAAVVLLGSRTPPSGVGAGTASATASGSATAEPSEPEPSTEVSESAAPASLPPPPAPLSVDSLARVTTNDLNVRQEPNRASDLPPFGNLSAGATVFVMDGPVGTDDGFTWYEVYVADGPYAAADCDPTVDCDTNPVGWVAGVSATNDAWLEPHEVDCPASPVSAEQLFATDRERYALSLIKPLACYGSDSIEVTGTLNFPCCGYVSPIQFRPKWLAIPVGPFFNSAAMVLHFDPAGVGIGDLERGDIIRATGHFDDASSSGCEAYIEESEISGDPGNAELPLPAWTVLHCRMAFVVEATEVTGHEDLGPCCG
jgi:hypothetical protein